MVLSTVTWTYGHFVAFVAPDLAGCLTYGVLEAHTAARLATPTLTGAIVMVSALALPGRQVQFSAAWMALAALPAVLCVLDEGGTPERSGPRALGAGHRPEDRQWRSAYDRRSSAADGPWLVGPLCAMLFDKHDDVRAKAIVGQYEI